MRTETITIYSYDELPETVRETVRNNFRTMGDLWAWSGEWWNSAQKFSRIAPIDIKEADWDRAHVTCEWTGPDYALRFDHSDEIAELSGLRAWKWLLNNNWFQWARRNAAGECTLTGYCGDCSFAGPLIEYEKNPSRVPDIKQVFYECAESWVYDAQQDCEYSYSDSAIDEMIEANDYEFLANGDLT